VTVAALLLEIAYFALAVVGRRCVQFSVDR
jgi:hypothetical protein